MPKFQLGQSGNPAGKKPGTKNKSTLLREGLAKHLPEILDKLVAQAKEGDMQAAKLLLERILPPLKPADTPVAVTGLSSGSIAEQGSAIIAMMAEGAITPNQTASMLAALAAKSRLAVADELTRRVEALEEATRRGE